MALSLDWRTIFRFAGLGFAVGLAAVGAGLFTRSEASLIYVIFLLCPGALLCGPVFVAAFEGPWTGLSFLCCVIVAVVNSIVYVIIGALYVGLRRKPVPNP